MLQQIRDWLNNLSYQDSLQQRQAKLLQIMLLLILGGCLIGLPLAILTAVQSPANDLPGPSYPLLFVCTLGALFALRSGHFGIAIGLVTLGFMLSNGIALIAIGLDQSQTVLLAFSVPIALAGLVLGRRGILLASGLSVLLVIAVALLQTYAPASVGFAPSSSAAPLALAATFTLIVVVFSLFLDLFGASLRDALSIAKAREQELERLRASLEDTIRERTASLQQALQEGEQRETRLAQTLEDLSVSQATIRELSAPVIPVLPGVLVTPLIGTLDYARATTLTNNVLSMVEQENARSVIFDITGVPVVDTQVAQVLLQAAAAVRLLGAQTMIVGIRPEVAETLVALHVDLGTIRSYPNLRDAVETLLVERYNVDLTSTRKTAYAS
jgi:rsbT co-antagonist protein RsbR